MMSSMAAQDAGERSGFDGEGPRVQRTARIVAARADRVRRVFRAFRRTRPFWGAVWLALGGAVIIHWSSTDLGVVLAQGWSSGAGYVLGGALIVFAVVAVVSPMYAKVLGIFGVLVALVAFPMSNLGGFVLGSAFGIIGGAMVWSWGEKKPRSRRSALGSAETDDA